jgi:anti-sigma factor RsiW
MTSPTPSREPDRTASDAARDGCNTCRDVIAYLMAYLDGDLPAPQRAEFERHLSLCPSCVNYLESYKETVLLGKAAMKDARELENVPEGLIRAIQEARLKG